MLLCDVVARGNWGPEDECWEWHRGRNIHNYGRVNYRGRDMGVHRLSYMLHVGPIPDGYDVDHGCGNPPCWNPKHLRAVTHAQNQTHLKLAKNSTTGYRGVVKRPHGYEAYVKFKRKVHHLGTFKTAEEAAAAAKAKRAEFGFLEPMELRRNGSG